MSETAREKRRYLTILAVVAPVALMLLAGFGVMYVSPLLDRPAPIRTAWTTEEIAALDDLYAFRVLASKEFPEMFPQETELIAAAENLPETENQILDDTGKTLAAWIDIALQEQEVLTSDPAVPTRILPPEDKKKTPRVQALVLYGRDDLAGKRLLENGQFIGGEYQTSNTLRFEFEFRSPAARQLEKLTYRASKQTRARRLAVVIDGEIQVAPFVTGAYNSEIVMTLTAPESGSGLKKSVTRAKRLARKLEEARDRL